ncbi:CsiV family protein [Pseudohongiella spirulinae]|uniref:Peptidoglycan-binding protein CsiV n=1 Tax=Pseudohongiella spirulinae TaxID=1249552 RepID=A0A0S2KDY0_9GAMM|nr:CsiV family protein [Pseudohongiella spirulinae]ALO46523.1 hypothetical protein PS2015_1875 [Pseudohongiella spirulinae]
MNRSPSKLSPWMRQHIKAMTALLVTLFVGGVQAQSGERWYQIELSIFKHENSTLNEENWPSDPTLFSLPDNARKLDQLMDVLSLPEWEVTPAITDLPVEGQPAQLEELTGADAPVIGNFRLPDFDRDAYLLLLPDDFNFADTNRALERSPAYRLLYHAAWRQPVRQAAGAQAIQIEGGRMIEGQPELDGSLTIRFNRSEDRVVLDTALWFNAEELTIPVRESRDMRSNEFHYLDHPVVGIVVQVFPYTVPLQNQM